MQEDNAQTRSHRWKYLRTQVGVGRIKDSDATVDSLGLEGWELTEVVKTDGYVHFWFKRPA